MSTRIPAVLLVSTVALAACGTTPSADRRVDLRAATGDPMSAAVGVAIDPTGARFVFDEHAGLYRFAAGGALELILPLAAMPDPGVVVRPPFTDLVALAPDRFALTAIGDGYLLDVGRRTMTRYFCYLPDGTPDGYDQRTDAVAYDPVAELLYAQPRTYDGAGNLVSSQLASYASATGVDLSWQGVPTATAAGGMVVLPDTGLVLGDGTRLLQPVAGELTLVDDLARFGVTGITGLALDPAAGTLLVLDGPGAAVVELDLADLGR